MSRQFQVAVDCTDPRGLGGFWMEALGYIEEPPPEGFGSWSEALAAWGIEDNNQAYALVDPDGVLPRLFFHQVPEGKTVKNRLHLDVRVSGLPGGDTGDKSELLATEAARLETHGAEVVETIDEGFDYFVVMRDPEGNEYCLT